jgi:hypothetical protein
MLAEQGLYLPRTVFSYLSLGPLRDKGMELSVEHRVNSSLSTFANYSWQARPKILSDAHPYPTDELQLPPTNRFNAGMNDDGPRYVASTAMNVASRAFWSDVLTPAYHGYTDGCALVNVLAGRKWRQGRLTTLVKTTNLLNQSVQQHVFGDIITRTVTFEVHLKY